MKVKCRVYKDGSKRWFIGKLLHNEEGPAVVLKDGSKAWYQYGNLHRIDGPAIINIGICRVFEEWWVNNEFINYDVNRWMKENNVAYPFDEETQLLFKLRFL